MKTQMTIPDEAVHAIPEITPADAVYGVLAWQTGRDEVVTISSIHDAAIVAKLADDFCKENNLVAFSGNYPNNLSYPKTTTPTPEAEA